MNFAYEDEVLLMVPVTAPADAQPGTMVTLKAHALWLVCREVCIPEETDLSLTLPVSATEAAPDPAVAPAFAATRAKLPQASPWQARFAADEKMLRLLIASPELARAKPKEVVFFPYTDGYAKPPSPQAVHLTDEGIVLATEIGWRLNTAEKRGKVQKLDGIVVVTGTDGRTEALEVLAMQGSVPAVASAPSADAGAIDLDIDLWQALLFAFLGGLILNLMPCVLPILSMKALALARKAGSPHEAHGESLAYGAGVVVSFAALAGLLLALRSAGVAVGWGFQLQEPIVVAALTLLMLAVALKLAGAFEIGGGRLAGAGDQLTAKGGLIGSFFTGALAVAVATPCTAPFMGAALGFALTQDAAVALGVFVALGIGFALPFIALGYIPALLRLIPKPGPWMNTFRQLLAFPMFATAAWLLWCLESQTGSIGLVLGLYAALAVAFALWAYGRS
jgi:thiol:disulfide interchange protein DsbD